MYLRWKGIILLICGCQMTSFVVGDCVYQGCDCFESDIYCAGLGLTSVPMCNSSNCTGYQSLYLDSNNITNIAAGTLTIGLTEISLIYNPIASIDDNAFDELSTTLQSLYFNYALLSRIPDAFLHLDSLQTLEITTTHVSDWNVGAMAHVGQTLKTLNLDDVGFTAWPDWIRYCENLTELDLPHNAISSIPDDAFDKLSNSLQVLTLSYNNFTVIPKSLVNLKNLTLLDMQHNKISNISWLPQFSKLSSLALNHNYISDANHLSDMLRPFADSLNSIALRFNLLREIPDLSFLPKMGAYDFSQNKISDPNSGTASENIISADFSNNLLPSIPVIYRGLKAVTIMFLSYNRINRLQDTDIPRWVVNVEVQNNLITELTDTSFPANSSLLDLTLDNNPIVSMSSLTFKNLHSLYILSMQHTKLTRLPLALTHLTSISYIGLNNNPELVCTCVEKSMGKLAPYIDQSGMCGGISIYAFLVELGPYCP